MPAILQAFCSSILLTAVQTANPVITLKETHKVGGIVFAAAWIYNNQNFATGFVLTEYF